MSSAGKQVQRRSVAAAALAALVLLAATAASAPGDLDPSFGRGGLVLTDFRPGADDRIREIVIQPDGRIVAIGTSTKGDCCADEGFALARYLPDGRLDSSFGVAGRMFVDNGDAVAAVRQPDGKIVVAGASEASGEQDLALVRFRADGSLDPSFGSGGRVLTNLGSRRIDFAFALALQADGKIVAVGQGRAENDDGNGQLALARYHSSGALDESFGGDGTVTTDLEFPGAAVAIQPDGRILVGIGYTDGPSIVPMARYTADGRLDSSFGRGGLVPGGDLGCLTLEIRTVAVRPDGRIIAAGSCQSRSGKSALFAARYTGDGVLDRRFGRRGRALTYLPRSSTYHGGFAAAISPEGRIVVAGGGGDDFVVARYTADGAPDTAFGGTGLVATDFGRSRSDYASAVAIQADGRIVAAGASARLDHASSDTGFDFALARHRADGRPGTRFASLSATSTSRGVLVRWRTASEVESRGFHLYERRSGSRRVRLTAKPIASRGGPRRGAAYAFGPYTRTPRVEEPALVFWIEEIKRDGRRVRYGPIVTVCAAGNELCSPRLR